MRLENHSIRAGTTIDPTRVTFTGWGFADGRKPGGAATLNHFWVVCMWFCYKNDYGEQVALPDDHNLTSLSSGAIKGKDVPDLGEMGMSPQQMEQICGAPIEPPGPDTKHPHVTRIHFRKAGYDLNCLFYEEKLFSHDVLALGQHGCHQNRQTGLALAKWCAVEVLA